MSKTLKNLFVSVLAALAIISFVTVGGAFNAKAETTTPSAPTGTKVEALTEKVDALESFKVLGTQVRTVDPLGMRFISVISDEDLAKLPADAQFGTLMIPSDLLDGDLTLDTALVANANAKVGYDGEEVAAGYKGYTGVIIGTDDDLAFPASDYAREFTAVGYVTYTYGDGQVDTIYTAEKTAILAKVADTILKEVGGEDIDETLAGIVNTVMGSTQLSVDNAALKTGETTVLNVTGMPEIGIEVQLVENDYVGFDSQYGTVYGKKVGTGKITFEVVSTGATCSTADITVSAIDAGKVDSVEFLLDDNSIDFATAAAADELLATALSANGTATVDGASVTLADNKITLTKPELDTDAIYGDKARVLTIATDDIEYTVNFNSIVAGYIVDNATELDNVNTVTSAGDNLWKGYVILNADIDYQDATFAGIAPVPSNITHPNDMEILSAETGFRGVFEGNGHYIDNMVIGTTETACKGFFGILGSGAVVKNLALIDVVLHYGANNGSGVIAAFGVGCNVTDVMVLAEVYKVNATCWTSNEGNTYTGKLGIAHSNSTGFTMSNAVLINNVKAGVNLEETAWPGATNIISSSKKGTYDNVVAISAYVNGSVTGITTGSDMRYIHDNSSQGLLTLDTTKFNSNCWAKHTATLDMDTYQLLGNVWFFGGSAFEAVDTWLVTRPPIVE